MTADSGRASSLTILPGLLLCAGLGVTAYWIAKSPWVAETLRFSPLLIVILLGMVLASLWRLPAAMGPGLDLAQKPILRWAVAGLGLRLSLQDIGEIGGAAVGLVVVMTALALWAGLWLGKLFGLDRKLSMLLATGGAICGASAIVAANTVVQAEEKDAAAGLGLITLWGTIGIFVYPWFASLPGLTHFGFGVWSGVTLHETAQVVAAASSLGTDAENVATVVKLARICLLAPVVVLLGVMVRQAGSTGAKGKVPLVPWFLIVFVVFAAIRTLAPEEGSIADALALGSQAATLLLVVGMAGVGLKTGFRDLKQAGWRAVAVSGLQWLILAGATLGTILALRLS